MDKYNTINRFSEIIKTNSIDMQQTNAENLLNKEKHHLSSEAKKRLKWMYIIHYECNGNIKMAANKIGISRTWLSLIHTKWENNHRDPRSLEPKSRAPNNTENRKRISQDKENQIIATRKKYPCWGQEKISTVLERDHKMKVGAKTINRYLHKHSLINIKLSNKNKLAWKNKKEKIPQQQKVRPPKEIKDYKPGALIEKDMKFIVKMGEFINSIKYKAKENFWFQHTIIDSFTRIKATGLAKDASSATATMVQEKVIKKLPFQIACANTDNGGENGKDFSKYLKEKEIFHFVSRSGTPTDNPRVERAHLTDEIEFYQQGNICKTFEEQEIRIDEQDEIYNYERPHQALGYLTPMEFYGLWKKDENAAYAITVKYQAYLKKQSKRLAISRRMKNKEKIQALMQQIDQKLSNIKN